jgi:hypothetical protein
MENLNPKRLTPVELSPILQVSAGLQNNIAATSICPRCGTTNVIRWGADGLIIWWPVVFDSCGHYQGAYSTGDFSTVQVRYK